MTTEIKNAKLSKMMDNVLELAGKYVIACNNGDSQKNRKALKKAAQAAMEQYNDELANETYRAWAEAGEPVLTALREYYIPGAKRLSFKVTDDNDTYLEVDNAEMVINLPAMQKAIGKEYFANPAWLNMVEKLAFLIAAHIDTSLDENPAFSYVLSEAAKSFEFAEDVKPATYEGVDAAIQQVFDAILFIDDGNGANKLHTYKTGGVASAQWTKIFSAMTKDGFKPGQVIVCNTGKMSKLIAECMHQLLTSGKLYADVG